MCGPEVDPEVLFQQAMAHMDLWLLQRQLELMTAVTATPEAINCCMQMLESAARKAAALALEGHDVSGYEAACASARAHIEAAAAERALQVALKYQLPPAEELMGASKHLGNWEVPKGVIPPPHEVNLEQEGLAAARKRAEKNLGSLKVMEGGKPLREALPMLLQLLQQRQQGVRGFAGAVAGGDVAVLLALRAVEQQLFSSAVVGFAQPASRLDNPDQVKLLEDVVDAYRHISREFASSKASDAFMKVELHSREVLVVWVAYCISFEAARKQHPLVAQYGVALDFKDLRHLVLSDKAAVDAALGVAEYLRQQQKPGVELFSLRDQGAATFSFAERFGRQDGKMSETWMQEKQDAEERVQKHWQEVQRKQKLATDLRKQLEVLRAEFRKLNSEADALYIRHLRYQTLEYDHARSSANTKSSEVTTTESQLRNAEKAPAAVIQPLPQAEVRGLQWIFFLYMPPVLRCLSRSSFLAQQLLLPIPDRRTPAGAWPCHPDELTDSISVKPPFKTSLWAHYSQYQTCSYHSPSSRRSGSEGQVLFRSYEEAPKSQDIGRCAFHCCISYP